MTKYGLSIPENIDEWAKIMSSIPLSGAEIDGLIIEAFQKGWNYKDRTFNISNDKMLQMIEEKKEQQSTSKDELLKIKVDRYLQELRISRTLEPTEEDSIKKTLNNLYKEKTTEEMEKEYKAKGFHSASSN